MNAWYIDAIIAIVNEQRQRLEHAMQYQPCGHPITAAITSDDGASHCQECERFERLMAQLDEWRAANEASMEASLLLPAQAQAEAADEPTRQVSQGQP